MSQEAANLLRAIREVGDRYDRIEVGGELYVLKQYKCMVLRRRLRYALPRTRSMQSWEQDQLMAEFCRKIRAHASG